MQTGTIFNIQPFSVYDGPGIRTTVFLKGCGLRCCWCHNPESIDPKPVLQFHSEKCIGCGACFTTCPIHAHSLSAEGEHLIDRSLCTACGKCADLCYAGALALTGQTMTAQAVFERVLEDKPYFDKSGGGVTFSGGEAMMQLPFLKELLTLCKNAGIHTAVDTAGYLPYESFAEILPVTDLFLYDIKAASENLHKKLIGASNRNILSNLPLLLEHGADVIVRIPCIPGGNWEDLPVIADYLAPLNVRLVELLAYHRLGEGKRTSLGIEKVLSAGGEEFRTPSIEEMNGILELFRGKGINAIYTA